MNLALGKPTQSFRNSHMSKIPKGNIGNSIYGTTAESFAQQQSSIRGDQKLRPGQKSVLQDESLFSSISQVHDKSQKMD